jgi:hypothetical protein
MLDTEITDSTRMRLKNNGISSVDDFINKSLDMKSELEDREYEDNKSFRLSEKRSNRKRRVVYVPSRVKQS